MNKTLLLSVIYTNGTGPNGRGEFWAYSYIKDALIDQEEGETIHATVKRAIEEIDHAELSYNGRPQSPIYVDTDQGTKIVGYVYRVKHLISDRHNNYEGYAYFDAWVNVTQYRKCNIELEVINT